MTLLDHIDNIKFLSEVAIPIFIFTSSIWNFRLPQHLGLSGILMFASVMRVNLIVVIYVSLPFRKARPHFLFLVILVSSLVNACSCLLLIILQDCYFPHWLVDYVYIFWRSVFPQLYAKQMSYSSQFLFKKVIYSEPCFSSAQGGLYHITHRETR